MTDDAPTTVPVRRRPHPLLYDDQGRIDLKSLDRDAFVTWFVEELGDDAARADRAFQSLWQHGVRSFAELRDVAAATREALDSRAYVAQLEPELVLRSNDGTIKYLWKLEDGRTVESVLIPDGRRVTLCMSSQVGCAMACTFCLTGDMGLVRHLKPSEIANQAMEVQRRMPAGERITNLVLMGMGEPLHNLDNLVTALEICLDDLGLNFSHRRITVSTVGLVPGLQELARRLPVNLAVSLNASNDAQRSAIMPTNKRWNLEALIEACRGLPLPSGKRIIFEYVMFEGFNDSLDDAQRLVDLLHDVPAKVNLIPYNENPERDLRRPSPETVDAFRAHLHGHGMSCTVRTTRGLDVSAACGQLGKAKDQAIDRGWLDQARHAAQGPSASSGPRGS